MTLTPSTVYFWESTLIVNVATEPRQWARPAGHRLVDRKDERDKIRPGYGDIAEVNATGRARSTRVISVLPVGHGKGAGRPEMRLREVTVIGVYDELGLEPVERIGLVDGAVIVIVNEDSGVVLRTVRKTPMSVLTVERLERHLRL